MICGAREAVRIIRRINRRTPRDDGIKFSRERNFARHGETTCPDTADQGTRALGWYPAVYRINVIIYAVCVTGRVTFRGPHGGIIVLVIISAAIIVTTRDCVYLFVYRRGRVTAATVVVSLLSRARPPILTVPFRPSLSDYTELVSRRD